SGVDESEVERQLGTFEIFTVVQSKPAERQIDFADQNAIGIGIKNRPHFCYQFVDFWLVSIVYGQITINGRPVGTIIRIWRIVAKQGVFDQKPKHIYTITIDAAIEPKPHHVEHGSANFRVTPIQVGLMGKKAVQIILIGASVERPRRTAEL